jgi:hypothetical protein
MKKYLIWRFDNEENKIPLQGQIIDFVFSTFLFLTLKTKTKD